MKTVGTPFTGSQIVQFNLLDRDTDNSAATVPSTKHCKTLRK